MNRFTSGAAGEWVVVVVGDGHRHLLLPALSAAMTTTCDNITSHTHIYNDHSHIHTHTHTVYIYIYTYIYMWEDLGLNLGSWDVDS